MQLTKDRGDLSKSKESSAHKTDFQAYINRLHTVAGHDTKNVEMKALKRSAMLQKQLNSFFLCDKRHEGPLRLRLA